MLKSRTKLTDLVHSVSNHFGYSSSGISFDSYRPERPKPPWKCTNAILSGKHRFPLLLLLHPGYKCNFKINEVFSFVKDQDLKVFGNNGEEYLDLVQPQDAVHFVATRKEAKIPLVAKTNPINKTDFPSFFEAHSFITWEKDPFCLPRPLR